jgi:hypothetical protein
MSKTGRDPRWWLGAGMIAGATIGAAYFLDPRKGRHRRERFARRARYGLKTAAGRSWHAVMSRGEEHVEDRTLLDRVESELFEDRSIPHGKFNLEVEGTTVVLRGQLDGPAEIARLEHAVGRVPGVGAVRSFLHLPGTPAPNKAAALAASAEALHPAGWPREAPPDADEQ